MPAIVAMPAVMTMNSSERLIRLRYGRISSGASTMPTNTFAAVPKLAAPEMPSALPSAHANPRTTHGSIRQ